MTYAALNSVNKEVDTGELTFQRCKKYLHMIINNGTRLTISGEAKINEKYLATYRLIPDWTTTINHDISNYRRDIAQWIYDVLILT